MGDLARRLAILNADAGMSPEEIMQGSGVVLIDELDLHLHPQWQRMVIRSLPVIFPNLQFVVSTHSPAMLSELDSERIINVADPASRPVMGCGLSSAEVLEQVMGADLWPIDIRMAIDDIAYLIESRQERDARCRLETLRRALPEDSPIVTSLETEINLFL